MIPNYTLKKWITINIILLLLLLLSLYQFASITNQQISLSFLDVGQGDAILIQTPEYKNILIDAGENSITARQLSKKTGFFNKQIDLFILTHPHRDHFGGLLDIMQKYKIKNIMLTGVTSHDPVYTAMLDEIKKAEINILFPDNNSDLQISNYGFLDIMYPFSNQSLIGQTAKNLNNTSIVTKLITDKETVMLTGDAEEELEKEILLNGQDVQSNILKLGHHGSRTATSDVFLNAVKPKTVVISAGIENKFGHPHEEIMEKVKNLTVKQTAKEGIIQLFLNTESKMVE